MDERVLATQRWLNTVYGKDSRYIPLDLSDDNVKGRTGWKTIYALTCALQIDAATASGVRSLKEDAGLNSIDATVSLNLMKALLSMDQFVLLKYEAENVKIRTIQQVLNASYESYVGLIPCDGLYGRQMNEALIKVLQAIEGLTPSEATGNFGPTTKSRLPILPGNTNASAVRLFRWCMVCNGYDNNIELGVWDDVLSEKVREMQRFHVLPVTGNGDVNTWMSLLLSKGNPDRSAVACDASTILNYSKALSLYNAGYRYIGRYLTGTVDSGAAERSKAMTRDEIDDIFRAGLRIFAIFQEGMPSLSRYTYEEGLIEGKKAVEAAISLGIPESSIIYFAIDYDVMDGEVWLVEDYFRGVNSAFVHYGYYYNVGIYGARNVCSRISASDLAVSSFISDMSTGFSGNMGYKMPANWAFDQFDEYTFSSSDGVFGLDKVAYSGRYSGFGHITEPTITLPDVSDDYRYKRAKDFMSVFGIILVEDFEYGVKVELDAGYFAVKYGIHKNVTITGEAEVSWATYNVTNGTLSVSVKEMLDGVYDQLGVEVTTNIGFTNASVAANAIMQMQNGTVKVGAKLSESGEFAVYIIAKEILRQSGPVTYSQTYEIQYIFRTINSLTPTAQPEFAYDELFSLVDWEKIGNVAVVGLSIKYTKVRDVLIQASRNACPLRGGK